MTSDCVCIEGTCTTCNGHGCGDCGYTGRCDCGDGYEASWGESWGEGYVLHTTLSHISALEHARKEMGMNNYHDGWKARWFRRMVDAGWRFWIWMDRDIMWRHSDEPTTISVDEAWDYFRQFVNTDGEYVPDPYEVQDAQRA